LLGNYADNVLDGRAGNDTLYGYDGNDTLIGGTGGDYMNGGTGIDTADYSTSYGGITIKLVDGKGYGGDAQGDTLVSIENVTGSSYSDYLFGNAEANVLDGGMGNDTLTGFDGADQLFGGYGNDSLDGGAGGDILNGGAGIDTAIYAKSMGSVYINLGKGAGYWNDAQGDTLTGIENVMGSSYNDYLYGDGQANVLDGYGGNDYLRGYAGNDTLLGGLGNDSLYGDTGNDTLDGGAGTNYLTGGDGADTFRFTKSATDTGTDTIWDYQDGQDLIDLSGTIIDDFAELQSNMSQNGSGVLIDIGEATIVIANTSLSVLDASDFIL
jgi:Ca2+-binding RTX toxin-like protein